MERLLPRSPVPRPPIPSVAAKIQLGPLLGYAVSGRPARWIHRTDRATVLAGAFVAASIVGRAIAGLGVRSPWIAPDEMTYGLIGRAFWSTGHAALLGASAPVYGVFPLLAGLPLALFGTSAGLVVAKVLGALVMAATGATVYLWARRLSAGAWGLVAPALTLAMPAFTYSGLLMKEWAFLPTTTLAVFLIARTLEYPSWRNQALALAGIALAALVRLSAVVLVPALVTAVPVMAWFCRDRTLLRRLAPSLVLLGSSAVVWLAFTATSSGMFGHFASLGNSDTPVTGQALYHFVSTGDLGAWLSWVVRLTGDVFLLVLGVPLIALLILSGRAALGRESDRALSALLAVTLPCLIFLIALGGFASVVTAQLVERQMIAIAPPLFVAFAVWLARGLPRSQPWTTIAALLAAAPALFLPVTKLVNTYAIPSAFMTSPLLSLRERTSAETLRISWLAAVAVAGAATILVPRRGAPALVVLMLVALAGASVLVQARVDRRALADRRTFFGTAPLDWIDGAAAAPVVYVDEDPLWPYAWHLAFWNPRLRLVATLPGTASGSVPAGVPVWPGATGVLLTKKGRRDVTLPQRFVLTRTSVTMAEATKVKEVAPSAAEPGLTLLRSRRAPTLSTWTQGLVFGHDLLTRATVTVYDCRSGRLGLSLLAKGGLPVVSVSVDGLRPVQLPLSPNSILRGWIPAPPSPSRRPRTCVYTISPTGPAEATGIVFVRGRSAATAAAARREQSGSTVFVRTGTTALHRENVGYCVGGAFQVRPAAKYPDAAPAIFVSGSGLTCDPPPAGFVDKGLAPADLGVPANTYRLYGPP